MKKSNASVPFENIRHIYFVAAHKLILNVSEPPWTAVVSSRSQFASANWQPKNEQGCSFLGVPAVNLCSRLVSTPLFSKKLTVKGSAERTRTSVVPYRSEFACKLVAHECTRMYIRGRGIYCVARGCPEVYTSGQAILKGLRRVCFQKR